MKKSKYFVKARVSKGNVFYSSVKNSYTILNNRLSDVFENNDINYIQQYEKALFEQLCESGLIIDDEKDELKNAHFSRMLSRMDRSTYQVSVNTTLDCNLDCWYCHENKIKGTKITNEVIELVEKNIKATYDCNPYKELKLSFFGGEPLLNINSVKSLIELTSEFCRERKIELLLDFTTNGTLISKSFLTFLGKYRVIFQITLDGSSVRHDAIRKTNNGKGTYEKIISNMHLILENIENSYLWVRFNYDDESIHDLPKILDKIDGFNRKKCSLIIRKVWQVDHEKISKETILSTLFLILKQGFLVDYYTLPHNIPCFAERLNQVLINYDGKVFKCSTRDDFNDENAEGTFYESGLIKWDFDRLAKKMVFFGDDTCYECKLYPACFGRCSEKHLQNKDGFECVLKNLNLNIEELVLFNLKLKQLQQKLYV
ncbi:radical SAM protein [Halosquirtibacter laminarini]|uniref:Radical SAM protein n=1 Tax=Halosquirtibacter laminarini TaxID=3374600 RepID=A0AC61NH26_9BACT|nr:radical SAM protein [Prolixibacteraceae bacterium]